MIEELRKTNPLAVKIGKRTRKYIRNRIDQLRLKNRDFTILANSCIGGVISHDLGLRFLSPTVNLYIEPHDFVKLLSDLDFYLEQEIVEIEGSKPYPVGQLHDITLEFRHFKTFAKACEKWDERKIRINRSNTYVILTDRMFLSHEDAELFDDLPFDNKILLTGDKKAFSDIKSSVYIPRYADKTAGDAGFIGNIINMFGRRMYQQNGFDYVSWLNDPKNYIEKYRKKHRVGEPY